MNVKALIIYLFLSVSIVLIALNSPRLFGTTLTTLSSSDNVSDFPTTYNANNTALNNGKIEVGTTSVASITTLPSLSLPYSQLTGAPASTFSYPFPSNATSTLLAFNAGLTAFASSTIGNGTRIGGLTVSGGATTTGVSVGTDTLNNWTTPYSPTHAFALGTGTTTSWTASTTGTAFSPHLPMPAAGTLRQVTCLTDQSFLGVNIQINGSNVSPSYFVSSTTGGIINFTAGNTFSKGAKILANFGTTTSAGTLEDSCTFLWTETI